MTEYRAIQILNDILTGLLTLHNNQIWHRDMKPANVLMTGDGVPRVTDLGVAHDSTKRSMTQVGTRLGTPEYMSPEQIEGEELTAASDIYACGIILYELLTGVVPFSGTSDFKIFQHHVQTAPDMQRLEGRCSEGVIRAMECALAKPPAERWPTADAFAKALTNPAAAEPPPPRESSLQ